MSHEREPRGFLAGPPWEDKGLWVRFKKGDAAWALYELYERHMDWRLFRWCASRWSMMILSSGGFWSDMYWWWYNSWPRRLPWRIQRKWWEWTHPKEHAAEMRFMRALWRVNQEDGLLDPFPEPAPDDEVGKALFSKPIIGGIMGKRYFERLKEILDEETKGN
jgi:hypothetical protein